MAKYRIIGEGYSFQDDWGLHSIDTCAVRINGTMVERLGCNNRWYPTCNTGQPIEKLLWAENESVHAVLKDGSIREHAAQLIPTPNINVIPWEYETTDNSRLKPGKEKNMNVKGGFFSPGWWWKWPFKAIWSVFKFFFITAFLDEMFGNKRK